MGNIFQHIEKWEAEELPTNKAQWEWEVWIDLWHGLPETWTEVEKLMQEEEMCNSSDTSKDSWKCSTPRFLEVTDWLRCSNFYVDWYMKMLANSSPVDPKVEIMLEQYKKENAILKPISPK